MPGTLDTLVGFADVTPTSGEFLRTSDRSFLRILEIAARQDSILAKKLLQDYLVRLAEAHRVHPKLLNLMEAAARSGEWSRQMSEVESLVEVGKLDPQTEGSLPKLFGDILSEVRAAGPASPETKETVRLLIARPRFSALLPEELFAFGEVRADLPSPRTLLSPQISQQPSDVEKDRLLAAWALPRLPEALSKAAEEGLDLRLTAARHLFKLRTFAKLDAFSHRWPDLAQRLRVDRSALIALESQVIEPQPLPPGLEKWWEEARQDERLIDFLKLRPLFLHIDQDVLRRYFKVAEATEAQAPRPAQQPTMATLPVDETVPIYENVVIRLRPELEDHPESNLIVEIESPLGEAHGRTPVSWPALMERLNSIPAARAGAPPVVSR